MLVHCLSGYDSDSDLVGLPFRCHVFMLGFVRDVNMPDCATLACFLLCFSVFHVDVWLCCCIMRPLCEETAGDGNVGYFQKGSSIIAPRWSPHTRKTLWPVIFSGRCSSRRSDRAGCWDWCYRDVPFMNLLSNKQLSNMCVLIRA